MEPAWRIPDRAARPGPGGRRYRGAGRDDTVGPGGGGHDQHRHRAVAVRDRRPRRRHRRGRLHGGGARHRARPGRRAGVHARAAGGRPAGRTGRQPVRGRRHRASLQPAGPGPGVRADPGPPQRPADRRAGARPRPAHLVALLHRHRPGGDGPARPCRRPGDPPPQAAPGHRVQHHVGPDRLHRGQRGHPAGARLPPGRLVAGPADGLRHRAGRDAEGQRPRLARQPVARGRGQHHR